MSYYGTGGQNGGSGRGGGVSGQPGQGSLLSGPPQHQQHQHQLFVNPNSIQFSTATQNFTFPGTGDSQGQLQLNTGGAPLLLQPPVNFVTDQLGLGQLITHAAAQNQQNLQSIMSLGGVLTPSIQIQQQAQESGAGPGGQSKQRVFTGTVTKIHDNFGFIDEEVFFQMVVVKGPVLPKEGDRVLVEADFNPSMPFKWNATRVQIVNMGGGLSSSNSHQQNHSQQQQNHQQQQQQSGYQQQQLLNFPSSMGGSKGHAVPPPPIISNQQQQQMNAGGGRSQQAVSIVSNPHSIYSGGGVSARPNNATHHTHHSHLLPDPLASNRRVAPISQLSHNLVVPEPPLISPQMNLPSLLKMDRERRELSRERDRKDREREDREDRQRERSKERQRDRERERRDRRSRTRSRSKERERKRRSLTPPPKRRSKEIKESGREKVSIRGVDRIMRDRSPLDQGKVERVKRSRSRDTVKSDTKSVTNNDRSGSITPRRNSKAVITKPPPPSTHRYSVELPKFTLDMLDLNTIEMKRRYPNLYVPSDFFLVKSSWMETFPLYKPFQLGKACPVHIFGRHVHPDSVQQAICDSVNQVPSVIDPSDSSCSFKVKVMILSSGSLEQIYKKAGVSIAALVNGKEEKETQHPLQRLLNFVVGLKTGKQEVTALGGAWSSSLDGQNPQSDPKVLINTAIRSVKALVGLDLSACTHWYRFMELYYRRSNGNLETTVYFLPDLSPCLPTTKIWSKIKTAHRIALYGTKEVMKAESDKKAQSSAAGSKASEVVSAKRESRRNSAVVSREDPANTGTTEIGNKMVESEIEGRVEEGDIISVAAAASNELDDKDADIMRMEVVDECNGDEQEVEGDVAAETLANPPPVLHHLDEDGVGDDDGGANKLDTSFDIYDDIVEVAGEVIPPTKINPEDTGHTTEDQESSINISMSQATTASSSSQPDEIIPKEDEVQKGTHYSVLEPKNLNVAKLREELAVRNLNTKGLKSQLTIRLVKALKDEETEAKEKEEKETVEKVEEENSVEILDETNNSSEEKEEERIRLASTIFETGALGEEEEELAVFLNKIEVDAAPAPDHSKLYEERAREKMEDGELGEEDSELKDLKVVGGIIKEGMSSEEKGIWERRWEVPKNPKLLLYPSLSNRSEGTAGKSGLFDCSSMTLSSLRDYRIVDKKEESFEVSIFSELFYEMLTRDFGFRIYQEIVQRADQVKDQPQSHKKDDEDKGAKKSTKESSSAAPPSKKRKPSVPGPSAATVPDSPEKMKTVEPQLLLAFLFFDQSKCGYLTDSTLEDICATIGLGLTRSQLRKKIQKVVTKGTLEYRKWTDKLESSVAKEEEGSKKSGFETVKQLSEGNKSLLPVFTYSSEDMLNCTGSMIENGVLESQEVQDSVLVTLDGHLVDVRKLKDQLEKAEKERLAAEANANVLKNSLHEAKNQVSELKKSSETMKEDLSKTKDSLKKLETCDKSNKDDLEIFRRATERFMDRVKDMVKLPTPSSSTPSPKEKESKGKESSDKDPIY